MGDGRPYDQGNDLPRPLPPDDRDELWRATRPSAYPNDPGFAGFPEPDPTHVVPIVGVELGRSATGRRPWYRQPGIVAALIAGGFALLVAVIAVFALDDDDGDASLVEATPPSTSSTSTTTTVVPSSTTTTTLVLSPVLPPAVPSSAVGPATTLAPTTAPVAPVPPTTVTTTTAPAPTTTVASATTTSSSTSTTSTSVAPTTSAARPETTEERPTTAETEPATTEDRSTTTDSTSSTDGSSTSSSSPGSSTTTTTPRDSTTTTSSIPRQDSPWDYIVRSAVLRELERYVRRADMVDVFERDGITVLAPIDQAFDDLLANPGGRELLEDPVRLRALLERHVLDQRLPERAIFRRTELTTIGGDVLPVDAEAGTIAGGRIVDPNQASSNRSILHVFDPVLVGDLIPG